MQAVGAETSSLTRSRSRRYCKWGDDNQPSFIRVSNGQVDRDLMVELLPSSSAPPPQPAHYAPVHSAPVHPPAFDPAPPPQPLPPPPEPAPAPADVLFAAFCERPENAVDNAAIPLENYTKKELCNVPRTFCSNFFSRGISNTKCESAYGCEYSHERSVYVTQMCAAGLSPWNKSSTEQRIGKPPIHKPVRPKKHRVVA